MAKTDNKLDLAALFKQRVSSLKINPAELDKLWKRTAAALAEAYDGGARLGESFLSAWRETGESSAREGYNAVQQWVSDCKRVKAHLQNGLLPAQRYLATKTKIDETFDTRLKTIEQKAMQQAARDLKAIVDNAVAMAWKVFGAVTGLK
ncbi:MAG: hypothetical protein IT464_12675 [Planctomycetes bacterium]|nr:hypothetical protein [Planctomycetota bacterium]